MVVEQEGGAVEPDRRLARARATLDGHQPVERGPDDLVLLGLDGGDDVEHLAGAGPLELGQQGVTTPEPGRAATRSPRAARHGEEVVGQGDDPASVDHDLPAAVEAESSAAPAR